MYVFTYQSWTITTRLLYLVGYLCMCLFIQVFSYLLRSYLFMCLSVLCLFLYSLIIYLFISVGSGGLLGPFQTLPDTFRIKKTRTYVRRKLLLTTFNDPPDTSQMIPNNFKKCRKYIKKMSKFWVRAVDLTTRLRKVIGQLQPLLLALRRSLRVFLFGKNSVPKKNVFIKKRSIYVYVCYFGKC